MACLGIRNLPCVSFVVASPPWLAGYNNSYTTHVYSFSINRWNLLCYLYITHFDWKFMTHVSARERHTHTDTPHTQFTYDKVLFVLYTVLWCERFPRLHSLVVSCIHLILIRHLLHPLLMPIVLWFWLLPGTMRLSNMHPYSHSKKLEANSV